METVAETVAPATKRLFKSSIKFCNFICANGKLLSFKGGIFATNDEYEIAQLEQAIRDKNPVIYIDPNATTLTAEQENPMLALRKKFFEEFMQEQAKHTDPSNDMGTSVQGPLRVQSTVDIAPVTIGGPALGARLAALKVPS